MILLDANISMYAAGAAHPNKEPSVRLLEAIARGELDAVIDAEALQEILHRYRAIRRWEDGREVYDLTRRIVPAVIPITLPVLDATRELLDKYPTLMARDALHAAVYRDIGAETFCSYDTDFDAIEGLHRVEPAALLQESD